MKGLRLALGATNSVQFFSLCAAAMVCGCLSADTGVESADTGSGSGSTGMTQGGVSGTEATATQTSGLASVTGTTSSPTTAPPTTTEPSTTGAPLGCDNTPLRVAAFNIQEVGFSGDDEFTGLAATLSRIGADVVCMQEVLWNEGARLEQLAAATGYDNIIQANRSPGIGGDPTNACLSKVPVGLFGSFSAEDISSDADANDVGRDILAIRVQVAPGCYAGMITVHLKAGFSYQDQFRRQVETERLVAVIGAYQEERPNDGIIVLGDFNDQFDDLAIGTTLNDVPSDLPPSYALGNDISLPLVYDPFERVAGLGLVLADATWEDSMRTDTWNNSSRLDYIFSGMILFDGAEVYNACEDDGVDNDPPGNWLPKEGEPLSCFASEVASDHLAVFADFTLP